VANAAEAPAQAQTKDHPHVSQPNNQFVDTFQKRWANVRDLALQLADAMPAESHDFKPVPAERSFGEQIFPIAQAITASARLVPT
jgi:hypothetical protein